MTDPTRSEPDPITEPVPALDPDPALTPDPDPAVTPTGPSLPALPDPTPEQILAQQVREYFESTLAGLNGDALARAIQNLQTQSVTSFEKAQRLQEKINADVAAGTPERDDIPATRQAAYDSRFYNDFANYALTNHPELNPQEQQSLRSRFDELPTPAKAAIVAAASGAVVVGGLGVVGAAAIGIETITGNSPGSTTQINQPNVPVTTAPTMPQAGPAIQEGDEIPPVVDDVIFCAPNGKVVSVESNNSVVQTYSGDPCDYPGAGQQKPDGDDLIIGL